MFLIAHNQIMLPKRYFSDIVPAVEELSSTVGAVFLNKLILDESNRPVEFNQAIFSEKPLTRIVTMHFQNGDMFDQFWDARERQDLWLIGKNYAYFCDTIMETGSTEASRIIKPIPEKESDMEILKGHGLTEREAEVMYWLCQGKSNGDIAYILNLSVSTVKKHLSNIFDSMGVRSRSAAVALALEMVGSQKSKIHLVF
ncbi:helix-turn-helix transcriptional regulator [Muricomes sp. OA1]|uniref:LuxR family transcriptional regulator n=1 Tax=Hungatella hathewayi TaxID=154046 RepID=A0A3E2WQS1_9FIRM|nr:MULTISPECIES: helix-turn-helix transcriptional regulator [Clostridia]MCH1973637.1 helix-turn-helix transcriptional regulator [Muricomes sp. OA1]RGC29615.1 LuxR family transcriptional regulator [Hungatella hathewayi]GKH32404.1 hypothetical protein CE91St64_18110 [Faecalicatena contorta]